MRRNIILHMAAVLSLLLMAFQHAEANDAVYFVNGNQLQPLQETDISVKKEVLTITIGEDGFAYVDVDYEFMNKGKAKTITMGFEAEAPYNDIIENTINKHGGHPHIMDFTVSLNGKQLTYSNNVVFAADYEGNYPKEVQALRKDTMTYVPVDFSRWEELDGDAQMLKNKQTGEEANYSYVYYFEAPFGEGINRVHHTYRYRMSFGAGSTFTISYWLTPAMRWANHQIDDFTLRIRADQCTKHFFVDSPVLNSEGFIVKEGRGKTRKLTVKHWADEEEKEVPVTEVVLRNGMVEWHSQNFKPVANMDIASADQLEYIVAQDSAPFCLYYDSGATFNLWGGWWKTFDDLYTGPDNEKQKQAFAARLRRNLPYAHRGYVFKDPELKRIFESMWWYMPDENWKPAADSFSQHEKELIQQSDNFGDDDE